MQKLIQITDCHLLADPEQNLRGVAPFKTLTVVGRAIQQKHGDADALVVCGDISEDGSPASYAHLINTLAGLNLPILTLPGNHDDYSVMQSQQNEYFQDKRFIELDNRWCVVCLHSQKTGELAGYVDDTQINWLAQQLGDHVANHFIVAVHHQPLSVGSTWIDRIGLQNGSELMKLLSGFPAVKMIIHGHVHQVHFRLWRHIACYATPSSWRQFVADSAEHRMAFLPPAYRVLELFPSGKHRSWVEFVTF